MRVICGRLAGSHILGVGGLMRRSQSVIERSMEILAGTPVFIGTRVPVQTLLDYLEAGQPLSEFLEDFPTVARADAVAALEEAKEALLAPSDARTP